MRKLISKLFAEVSGATAIEYGLIACLISVAIITVVTSIGTNLNNVFTSINNAID